jgi:TonB family protein
MANTDGRIGGAMRQQSLMVICYLILQAPAVQAQSDDPSVHDTIQSQIQQQINNQIQQRQQAQTTLQQQMQQIQPQPSVRDQFLNPPAPVQQTIQPQQIQQPAPPAVQKPAQQPVIKDYGPNNTDSSNPKQRDYFPTVISPTTGGIVGGTSQIKEYGKETTHHVNTHAGAPFVFAGQNTQVREYGGRGVDNSTDLGAYLSNVQAKVNELGPKKFLGQIVINFHVHKDGSISAVKMLRSSGMPQIDATAVDAIKKSAPFEKISSGLEKDVQYTFDSTSSGTTGRAVFVH